jgi:(1->4)-alpha-D-glucan 1-alpha-D-glucosylmutase
VTLPPRATYRVQLHAGFTFDDARAVVPYLAALGVSHLYCSPVLQAARGSTHGYDVVDHSRVSFELGGQSGFERLADALREHGMGLVLDIVPNHMAIGEENRWWWDVLKHGRASRHAARFDIDWEPPDPRLRNVVLLPVLADDYPIALESGQIRLLRNGDEVLVAHGDLCLPLDPRTLDGGTDEDTWIAAMNEDHERLDTLLSSQHWRLASWRAASTDLNYRRFFDVDALIGLRMEEPDVFRDTHSQVLEWVAAGRVDGLRIDHPDGLRDPAAYFGELRAAAPEAWIVAEKILEPDEALRADWPVQGTTGYGFANLTTGLQVDAGGEAGLSEAWAHVADAGPEWEPLVAEARREVLASALGSDLNRLTKLFSEVSAANPGYGDFSRGALRDALLEVAAALGVYRTYVRPGEPVTHVDAGIIAEALGRASMRRPDLGTELFDLLGRILRLEVEGSIPIELAMRFQQLTPAAMAKGVEDTAFYRHHRLVALNEVGGDPGRFGTTAADFHAAMQAAQESWPLGMLALSTHDTKRSADVRARLALLAEEPEDWRAAVARLTAAAAQHRKDPDAPTRADAYLFFQTVVGAWPIEADRVAAYLEKASREAKLRTSWTEPQAEYEGALAAFVRGCLSDPSFEQVVEQTVEPLIDPGRRAALAQVALQLTAPGVPDIYQGNELWDLALVDPDNRRAVNFDLRLRLLDEVESMHARDVWDRREDGSPKLWLINRTLAIRQRRAKAFGQRGTYQPLLGRGSQGDAVVAFVRGGDVITVVPRLPRRVSASGWADTVLDLPSGRWRGLDGAEHVGAALVAELLGAFPVTILERVE